MIASQLGSGQFDNETTSGDWGWSTAEWRTNPTLRTDLYVKYADGTEQLMKSDDSWRTSAAGPIRYDNHYLGETFDARRDLPGWDTPSFDAGAWAAARTVTGPAGRVTAQKNERTSLIGTFRAGHGERAATARVRVEHRPAARGLGDGQGPGRAGGHADPDPLRREARRERAGQHHRLHACGPDPDRLLHRQGHRDRRRSRRGSRTRASSTCRSRASAARRCRPA